MHRARIAVVSAVALVPLVVPVPAHAAQGQFLIRVEGMPQITVNDPPTDKCTDFKPVRAKARTGRVIAVENKTDTAVIIFRKARCDPSGGGKVVPAAQKKFTDLRDHLYRSYKFGPQPK